MPSLQPWLDIVPCVEVAHDVGHIGICPIGIFISECGTIWRHDCAPIAQVFLSHLKDKLLSMGCSRENMVATRCGIPLRNLLPTRGPLSIHAVFSSKKRWRTVLLTVNRIPRIVCSLGDLQSQVR